MIYILDRYLVIKRLCLIGGFLLFSRYFLSFIPSLNVMDLKAQPSTEWLRGEQLCTFKSKAMWHLGWSVPMADPSYYVMGAGIHSFLMFAPFFALYEKKGMVLQGCFLFAFGPLLASMISDNLMEQASIWCFFSIAQVFKGNKQKASYVLRLCFDKFIPIFPLVPCLFSLLVSSL